MSENHPPNLHANTLASEVLREAGVIALPLVALLVRSGVSYTAFVAALKPIFMAQALVEAKRTGQKATDSALSLLSGLHRKDVRKLRASARSDESAIAVEGEDWGKPSAASQVATRWLGLGWPERLPFSGPEPSFESLVKRVSADFHHRAVLQELSRLGVARENGDAVELIREAFIPDRELRDARRLMAGSVADHLAAGVHNLTTDGSRRFLEQSVFADGLSEESVAQLHQLANRLWAHVLDAVVAAAVPLCEQDAHLTEGAQRFRLGLFSFSTAQSGHEGTTSTRDDHPVEGNIRDESGDAAASEESS